MFEQELQALVDKYDIGEVEVTYKKKAVFKPISTHIQNEPVKTVVPEEIRADEALPEDEAFLNRYLGGTTGKPK